MRGGWAATILAIVMAIIGIVLTIGGAWLAVLGGSLYYLLAGIALLVSAWLLFRGRLLGAWIYVGLFILTAIWGFAESRGNAWAMVPWLAAPLMILIWTLLVMPTLAPGGGRHWGAAWGGIAVAIIFVAAS
ncbi:MAG TPA: membrane-bound PQQ-dependent dehydrogenase, glucose/quinate/shikimate family, partial [Sphingomicrobium sp.]|nr:membrane-bound PQQ-dependent dehydrogenase, glucose/quinate/shikimate family [Sphingomicrobium sp.]